jgi:hypothetical protein
VKGETNPPSQTLFFDIDLGIGAARRLTAVFFPVSFTATASPDVLVYFHGIRAPTIDRYLELPAMLLREETNKADSAKTQDLILVAPTLGPACEAGEIVDSGLDWYLGEVLSALAAGAPDRLAGSATPSFGTVYLAAHSGGGRPARAVALKKPAVAEYWLFDALYGPSGWPATDKTDTANVRPLGHPDAVEEEWLEVLETQGVKLYDCYLTDEPTKRSKNLEHFVLTTAIDGEASFVRSSSPNHDRVPITHWKELVNGRS